MRRTILGLMGLVICTTGCGSGAGPDSDTLVGEYKLLTLNDQPLPARVCFGCSLNYRSDGQLTLWADSLWEIVVVDSGTHFDAYGNSFPVSSPSWVRGRWEAWGEGEMALILRIGDPSNPVNLCDICGRLTGVATDGIITLTDARNADFGRPIETTEWEKR
ncbi:MAG: hypothetical protein ACE5FJ_01870 [Gemmatimonadales bacterium]